MITKKFYLKNNEEILNILGPQDLNLKELEKKYKVSIYVKHNPENESATLTIKGKKSSVDKTIKRLTENLQRYYELKIIRENPEADMEDKDSEEQNIYELDEDVILRTEFGELVKPKTSHQKKYTELIEQNDIVIAIGPAGTGKTFLATAMALKFLKEKKVRRIVVTRPIVESGEKLGFLPGDIEEKVNPYLRPIYDNFYDLLGPEKFQIYKEEGIIETLPLAYMRGRTLEHSFIILDEAQNTTTSQMKMFLTRMGNYSKVVVTGDITQIDLKEKHTSGLLTSIEILKNIDGIKFCKFDESDIVRHPLVSKIIKAYEEWEEIKK